MAPGSADAEGVLPAVAAPATLASPAASTGAQGDGRGRGEEQGEAGQRPGWRSWRRVRRALARTVPLLLVLFAVVHTGRIGIELGHHWDEHLQLRLVARTVRSGVMVPGIYNYPTLSYWLTLAAASPRILAHPHAFSRSELLDDLNTMRSLDRDTTALQTYLLEDHALFLRVRTVFLLVSSLGIAWVYLLVLAWRRNAGEAFLAAAFLGLSWEFAYHARWIAPDLVMTSFTALTVLLTMMAALRTGNRRWLLASAVAAGLATGTKYQCALLFMPVLIAAYQTRSRLTGRRAFVVTALRLFAVFVVTFLFTTPAALLDSGRFRDWVHYVVTQYKSGDLGGYAVPAGPAHVWKLLVYFGSDFFSVYRPIAVPVAAFIAVGAWALWRESRQRALLFLCFPAVYLAYMSTQRVLVVRNVLVVTPFLAILAARGVGFAFSRLRWRPGRWLAVGAIAVALAFNTVWLYQAAFSIRRATPDTALLDCADYVNAHPGQVYASAAVRAGLARVGRASSPLAASPADAKEVAFYPDDWADFGTRPANVSRFARTWFGPFELNWNYYTTWMGFQRIVLAPAGRAIAMGVRL